MPVTALIVEPAARNGLAAQADKVVGADRTIAVVPVGKNAPAVAPAVPAPAPVKPNASKAAGPVNGNDAIANISGRSSIPLRIFGTS